MMSEICSCGMARSSHPCAAALKAQLTTAHQQIAELKTALEHYADEKNWEQLPGGDPDMHDWYRPDDNEIWQTVDNGWEIAQQALSKTQ